MIEPGTKVWIPYSQDGWHSGEVVATTSAGVRCVADDGEVCIYLYLRISLLFFFSTPSFLSFFIFSF